MDFLLNNIFFLIILVATAIIFTIYSAFTVRKRSTKAYFGSLLKGSTFVFLFIGEFLMKALGLLAHSAKTKKFGKESDIAPSGGVLNYRSGKLDDGTDPVGWYEKD